MPFHVYLATAPIGRLACLLHEWSHDFIDTEEEPGARCCLFQYLKFEYERGHNGVYGAAEHLWPGVGDD